MRINLRLIKKNKNKRKGEKCKVVSLGVIKGRLVQLLRIPRTVCEERLRFL